MTHDDHDLGPAFAELRRADAEKAPPFVGMWQPRPKRVSPFWIAAPAFTVVAAAAAVIFLIARPAAEPAPVASASPVTRIALDPAPLDFLLDQPTLAAAADFDSDPLAEAP